MSYYSDVAIALKREDFLMMMFRAAKLDDQRVHDFIVDGIDKKHSSENIVILHWERVKWICYEKHFPEVIFIENFLKEVPDHDMVKMGEDYDDVYAKYGLEDYVISIERKISFNL